MADISACTIPIKPAAEASRINVAVPNWTGVYITGEAITKEYSRPVQDIVRDRKNLKVVVTGDPNYKEINKVRSDFRKQHINGEQLEETYGALFGETRNLTSFLTLSGVNRTIYFTADHATTGFDSPLKNYSLVILAKDATRTDLLLGLMTDQVHKSLYPMSECSYQGKNISWPNFASDMTLENFEKLQAPGLVHSSPAGQSAWQRYFKSVSLQLQNETGLAVQPIIHLIENQRALKINDIDVSILAERAGLYFKKVEKDIDQTITAVSAYGVDQLCAVELAPLKMLIKDSRNWIDSQNKR